MSLASPAFRYGDTDASKKCIADHLKRLDKEDRTLRFFSNVSDEFIDKYVANSTANNSFWIVVSDFNNQYLVAALHIALDPDGKTADIGFSVEKPYGGRGIGTRLMETALLTMRPMRVESVRLNCLSENKAVQAICKKVGIDVSSISYMEKEGNIQISKDISIQDLIDITRTSQASIFMPSIMATAQLIKQSFPMVYSNGHSN